MVEINPNALVYLVQLVDEKLQQLKQQVATSEDDEALAEYEDELMACSKVAMELERCYQQAAKVVGNIPPYAELLQRKI
ncbi:hypothetical protein [Aquabacterium sp.]|uniref:hypothetical protein n=1 Tax=Aquabacterium sp. TaxID=1872578 RepID=UPI0035B16A71